MKKLSMLFLVAVMILLLVACSHSRNDVDASTFVGMWIGNDRSYQLFEDGSGILNLAFMEEPYHPLEWKIKSNKFITIFSDGFEAEFEYKISNSELTLSGMFGVDTYTRNSE